MKCALAATCLSLWSGLALSAVAPFPSTIFVAEEATENEIAAANVLQKYLATAKFSATITRSAPSSGTPMIAVGYDAATSALGVPTSRIEKLAGNDSYILSSKYMPPSIAIASTKLSMRGAILGAHRLLETLGFDFIAPVETLLPTIISTNATSALDSDFVPVFESRDNDEWPSAHNPDWALALGYNGANAHGTSGGYQKYASPPGFVHTSYNLLAGESGYNVANCKRNGSGPCLDVYNAHPEWFWPKNNPSQYGQLCWTEPTLIEELKRAVRDILSKDPDANIISVSQNDNYNYCNTSTEAAVIAEEGSPQGPLLRAVNAIAEDIEKDFPNVAVDTLAYQYTRSPPKLTKPRHNVIVRLCSIECNFAKPLYHPSNAPFNKDMMGWAAISNRTYIWNYVTNFAAYLQPFPNYYVVGENIKYFASRGVAGLFEEGSYTTPGGDMEFLKDYVMGKVLLDPSLDPYKLITTFLDGYYGPAAPFVRSYMDLFHGAIDDADYYMHESFDENAPFLTPIALLTAKASLDKGQILVAATRYAQRVRVVKMAIQYVALLRWDALRAFAASESISWPFADDKSSEWKLFNATATSVGVTTISEGKCDLACFKGRVFPKQQ